MATYGKPDANLTRLLAVQGQDSYDATHDTVQELWIAVPDGSVAGATSSDGGATWTNPPAAPPPAAAFIVDVPSFKMRFAPAELLAVRACTDPIVKAFLAEIIDDPRTERVNLALPFVQGAVAYLAGETDLGAGRLAVPVISPARVAQILAPDLSA